MMAELKRKEDQLTTAELASRSTDPRPVPPAEREAENPERPKPVRSETAHDMQQEHFAARSQPEQIRNAAVRLFSEADIGDFRSRWSNVQANFVDEPRRSVEEADKLVATVMQRLAEGFANERSNLEKQWGRGNDVSTEDLRVALQRYRSFFDRLLNA